MSTLGDIHPVHDRPKGLMIAAPASGSGKTMVTLALLRALSAAGVDIRAAKAGPDYIDPGFHKAACGHPSVNLDPWAMDLDRLQQLAFNQRGEFLLVEAMMGLFDGAADGSGSAGDLACTLGIPVALVVDCTRQSHSIAALVKGFKEFRQDIEFAGIILNNVGSVRHETLLREALVQTGIAVLGVIYRSSELVMPDRHLGLVQAEEMAGIELFMDTAAGKISEAVDVAGLLNQFTCLKMPDGGAQMTGIMPLGQKVAIARDEAFSFLYPHMLADWQRAGASISFFSPLADEAPDDDCDAVYLPGGYPELHAGRIGEADTFKQGARHLAGRGCTIYGECGGYMVLGDGLVDGQGAKHKMLGLLRLETSFAKRKLSLGYRNISSHAFPLGNFLKAHEFHYSTIVREDGQPLFEAEDARGENLGHAGLRQGNVMGSYMHLIEARQS